jgi:hypothetical protein
MLLMHLSCLVDEVNDNFSKILVTITSKILAHITRFARKPPPSWLFFKLNSRLRSTSW